MIKNILLLLVSLVHASEKNTCPADGICPIWNDNQHSCGSIMRDGVKESSCVLRSLCGLKVKLSKEDDLEYMVTCVSTAAIMNTVGSLMTIVTSVAAYNLMLF